MLFRKRVGGIDWIQASLSLVLLYFMSAIFASTIIGDQTKSTATAPSHAPDNGFYAVLLETPTQGEAQCRESSCTVLTYDKKYSNSDLDEPLKYVVLDTSAFVPLIIEGAPDAKKDASGKTILGVTLKKEYVQLLEDFSRAHLGGRVAIVVGGEIITLHKIRSVISGGQLQITRCTDNACEILKAKLAK